MENSSHTAHTCTCTHLASCAVTRFLHAASSLGAFHSSCTHTRQHRTLTARGYTHLALVVSRRHRRAAFALLQVRLVVLQPSQRVSGTHIRAPVQHNVPLYLLFDQRDLRVELLHRLVVRAGHCALCAKWCVCVHCNTTRTWWLHSTDTSRLASVYASSFSGSDTSAGNVFLANSCDHQAHVIM